MLFRLARKVIQVWDPIDPTDPAQLPATVNGMAFYLDSTNSNKPTIRWGATDYDLTALGGGGGAVTSVFGRVGAVVAQAGDIAAGIVGFTPDGDLTATNAQAAIVELRDDTDTKLAGKAAAAHVPDTGNPHGVTAAQAGADATGTAAAAVATHEGGDNHAIYPLADGSRGFSGAVSGAAPTAGAHLATRDYVDNVAQGLEWQDSVFDRDLATPPGSPSTGDRYIVASGGTGAWSTHDDKIADWDGSAWVFTAPSLGMACGVDDESRTVRWNGSAWAFFGTTIDHGNLANSGTNTHAQLDAEATASAAHRAASNPHSGSQATAEKDQANGYAGLDATSKLDGAQLPYGVAGNTACEGDDARLSDSRTPTSHASSHAAGGGDALKLDDLAAPDDNTDLNASTSAHGLLPKLPGGTTSFLRADGSFATPAGSSPLTTKGDLHTFDTGDARLPVGADGRLLRADSSQSLGVGWGGDVDLGDSKIDNIERAQTNIEALGTTGSVAVDFDAGCDFQATLTGNITAVTESNPPGVGKAQRFTILLKQAAASSFTLPASWAFVDKWANGSAPVMPTANDAYLIVSGTSYAGYVVAQWKDLS